jgi:hypothetical protein
MGYYKNIDALNQERIDQTVRWWKEHNGVLPEYLMSLILADENLFELVAHEWELATFREDMPATKRMTRKESDALLRQQKREAFWTMTWQECRFVTLALYTSLVAFIALLVTTLAVAA